MLSSVEGKVQKDTFSGSGGSNRRQGSSFFFFFFFLPLIRNQRFSFLIALGQEQQFLLRYEIWSRSKSKHKGIACVWRANSSQALNNKKITKLRYIFKGSVLTLIRGKEVI